MSKATTAVKEKKPKAVTGPAAPTVKRGKGRPKLAADRVSAEEIVTAACELLRTTPLHKLTAAVVAQRAGVNPTLINYYFKGRAELLIAAAAQLMKELRLNDGFGDPSLPLEERLRSRFVRLIEFYEGHPFFGRLLSDEIMNTEPGVAHQVFVELALEGIAEHENFLQTAAYKSLREVDPTFFFISIVGMCEFYHSATQILRRRFGPDMDRIAIRDRYVDYAVQLMLNGLRRRD